MNIAEAERQIETTARAYAMKDENGMPRIPVQAQRPLYLVGPPGVGKTAIVAQAASRLGIGLVSYTMTHHTRQSALGLPQIVKCSVGGREVAVTQYTMSEILLGVYRRVEAGQTRGILFLDEINCVSETLMPALLELLQHKRFGEFCVPEGWMIVCAGNPERYNRSARAFDPVTLDRLRVLEVEADLEAWMDFAAENRVCASIRGYLRLRPQDFYVTDGDNAVTPRSWTDLSYMLETLERMGEAPDRELCAQYLLCPAVAESFALYEALGRAVAGRLKLDTLLDEGTDDARVSALCGASFDETLYAAMLLADHMRALIEGYERKRELARRLESYVDGVASDHSVPRLEVCREHLGRMERALEVRREVGALSSREAAEDGNLFRLIRRAIAAAGEGEDTDVALRGYAASRTEEAASDRKQLIPRITRGLDFADAAFTDRHVKVIFLSELTRSGAATRFLEREMGERLRALRQELDPKLRTDQIRSE